MEDCIVDSFTNEQPARAKVLKPTFVRVIGEPRYTQGPPAPYVYNVNREILDQNTDPMNYVMYVMENYVPPVPTGNCTSLPVEKNDDYSTSGGTFGPDRYYLPGNAPNPCSSESTQHFKVRWNGVTYDIQTTYKVKWQFSGVTVTPQ